MTDAYQTEAVSAKRASHGGRLIVIGAGGHGKVAADCARAMGRWSCIVFLDARWPQLTENGPWQVIGSSPRDIDFDVGQDEIFVGIGAAKARCGSLEHLAQTGHSIATIIHPSAIVSPDCVLERGCLLAPGAIVNIGSRLAVGCIVNTGASVDHDCVLGMGVHVCPGARLAGGVQVGAGSWIGIGAAVRQGIRIGAGVTVGAGAAVVADVPDGATVVGVPARLLTQS